MKKEVKLYVTAHKWLGEYEVEVSTHDRHKYKSPGEVIIPLSEVTVEIDVPDVEKEQLMTEEIKQLQEQIQKERADSYVRITAIEEKIQSLMSIEHNPEGV